MKEFEAIVLGAGVNGLCAAWQLGNLGCGSLALLERFEIGHARGSSHGYSRIIRSSYPDADWVRLTLRVQREDWPFLERSAGTKLVHPIQGCIFGPSDGLWQKYSRAVREAGADVEALSPGQARRVFPQFRFENTPALADRHAGLIDAAKTIQRLHACVRDQGCVIHENEKVQGWELDSQPIAIHTEKQTLKTRRLIVAAGPWVSQLLPELAPRLIVKRQSVGYFHAPPSVACGPDSFPVWAYIGMDESDVCYGLPEFGREGLKAAWHQTSGAEDSPDDEASTNPERLEKIERFLREHLAFEILERIHAETCYYTNTASHDFILDRHPDRPNVVVAAGFSGHGFKFAPLTGRILAELALNGECRIPEFTALQTRFGYPPR